MKLLPVFLAALVVASTISLVNAAPVSPRNPAPPVVSTEKTVKRSAEKTSSRERSATVTAAKAERGKSKSRQHRKKGRERIVIDMTTTSSVPVRLGEQALGGLASSLAVGKRYGAIIARHASENGVPVSLAHAVIGIESNYRPDARGSAGEIGLMQIKPATARMMGYRGSAKGLYDPETNIRYGMKYLGMARKLGGGETCATILRYNAGHAAKRMNPVSSAYCRKVQRALGT